MNVSVVTGLYFKSLNSRRYYLMLAKKYLFLVLLPVAAGLWLLWVYFKVGHTLESFRERADRATVAFKMVELKPPATKGLKLIARRDFRDIIWHDGKAWAATASGLLEMDAHFSPRQLITSLDGLPSNDLTCLAAYAEQLFFGTADGRLLSYDGKRLHEYRFEQGLQRLQDLSVINGRLYIAASRLLSYDGKAFHLESEGALFTTAAELNGTGYFGTFAHGLVLKREGSELRYGLKDGLPSQRVVSVQNFEGRLLVATDLGLAELESGQFRTLLRMPGLSSFQLRNGKGYVTRDTGDLFEFDPVNPSSLVTVTRRWPPVSSCRLSEVDGHLFLLTDRGVWATERSGVNFRRLELEQPELSDNAVSSLAVDARGRLWIGYFARGIDVTLPSGELLAHIEDEFVREINSLFWDFKRARMLVATSSGLHIFNEDLRSSRLDEKAGIISKSISSVSLVKPFTAEAEEVLALSTARGLSLESRGRFKNYTTLHGLTSSAVYAACTLGNRLYVGTLGGLAVFEAGRLINNYSQSNSGLSANWVTALVRVENKLYIGTYGGGVDVLEDDGRIRSLEIGRFEVNFNAMVTDGRKLYVGTLDDGLWTMDLTTKRWKQFREGLPTGNVMSIAIAADTVYIGTINGIVKANVRHL